MNSGKRAPNTAVQALAHYKNLNHLTVNTQIRINNENEQLIGLGPDRGGNHRNWTRQPRSVETSAELPGAATPPSSGRTSTNTKRHWPIAVGGWQGWPLTPRVLNSLMHAKPYTDTHTYGHMYHTATPDRTNPPEARTLHWGHIAVTRQSFHCFSFLQLFFFFLTLTIVTQSS